MDAKTVGQAAGVQVGTLNAWIQRGLVRGITADSRGRLRVFDVETATLIGVMAQLMQLGFGAPVASMAAMASRGEKRLLYAKGAIKPVGRRHFQIQGRFGFVAFNSEAELTGALSKFADGPPDAYVVINVEQIADRMRQAQEEWERKTGARKGGRQRSAGSDND